MADWQRTHTCGELRDSHVGQTVTLNGWVNTYRAHPNQVFIDLRDRYGITQIVFEDEDKELFALVQSVGREFGGLIPTGGTPVPPHTHTHTPAATEY